MEFQYCNNNANYDDIGQMDAGCGDNYSSLSGVDSCGMVGGMNQYQQGLLGLTPSYCNQAQDYVGPKLMYNATAIPAYAGLQYFPTTSNTIDNQVVQQKIISAAGQVAPVAGQVRNPNEAAFMQMVSDAAAATGVNAEKFGFLNPQFKKERYAMNQPLQMRQGRQL